ncbi:YqjF family protein [Nocardioides litoris]|uniref:YqjF family protein n=1 Tax=Nocardioides litoris TaxID=1926648 RepID=UPI00111CB740|nr:DUF2071 domain-containing protein [Nocardioides litoris]
MAGTHDEQHLDPQGPPLDGPAWTHQHWRDLTYLHWRVDPDRVAPLLPRGTRPDVHDGATWVGLIPFTLAEGALGGRTPGVPYLGTFLETNVRLYSIDDDGRRGVVFRSLETERLAMVAAANAALRVPYKWADMDRVPGRDTALPADPTGTTITYRTRRRAPGRPSSEVVVEVGAPIADPDPLQHFLSARFGAHTRAWGRTLWVPNTHSPWPLREARLLRLHDELVAAAGLPGVARSRPESVLFSTGVHTWFGPPVVVG